MSCSCGSGPTLASPRTRRLRCRSPSTPCSTATSTSGQQSKQEAIQALTAGFAEQIGRLKRELDARDSTVSSISHLFREARRRSDGPVEPRPQDQADQLPAVPRAARDRSWRASSACAGLRSGSWTSRDSSGTTTRSATRSATASSSGSRRSCASRRALRTSWPAPRGSATRERHGPGPRPDSDGRRCTASARPLRRRRVLLSHPRHRVVPPGARHRRALPIGRGTLRLDAGGSPAVGPAGRVDVGVVCLRLGPIAERRPIARRLAQALVARADTLMYEAKGERADHVFLVKARVENGAPGRRRRRRKP